MLIQVVHLGLECNTDLFAHEMLLKGNPLILLPTSIARKWHLGLTIGALSSTGVAPATGGSGHHVMRCAGIIYVLINDPVSS